MINEQHQQQQILVLSLIFLIILLTTSSLDQVFTMPALKPFQLLEINVISAQDLEPVSKKMKTFATAWVHSNRKMSTRVDRKGHTNPNWNDKFVFRVDDEFLKSDTSAVMIQIYATGRGRWKKDALVGTVRVLVGNLIPAAARPNSRSGHHIGMRFVALQVRRPSGRPQGILNLGVSLLDSTMRSMPLYSQLSASAVGFNSLLEEVGKYDITSDLSTNQPPAVKPTLRRSRSERSERFTYDNMSSVATGSMVALPEDKGCLSSEVSEPLPLKIKGKKGKASSVISGAEIKQKAKSKSGRKKGSSVLSDSLLSKNSLKSDVIFDKPIPISIGPNNKIKILKEKSGGDHYNKPLTKLVKQKSITKKTNDKVEKPISKYNGYGFEYGGGPKSTDILGPPPKPGSILDSEIGPSPSEVAAAIAQRKYPLDDERGSMLDTWSVDESVEGLRSKLERWQRELPPMYDRSGLSSSSFRSTSQRQSRRITEGGETGLFSCFGNIYGYECQCICGKPPPLQDGGSSPFLSP